MKTKGGQHSFFFKNNNNNNKKKTEREKEKTWQQILTQLQLQLSFDHTRRTIKVIDSTSYPLSMAFIFSFFFFAAYAVESAVILNFTDQFHTT